MTQEEIAQIDASLGVWRQGDIVFGAELPALHLAHLSAPVTDAAKELAIETEQAGEALDLAVVTRDFEGFMVVSQTCDIVRSVATREFVELCPLVPVEQMQIAQVRRGRMPRYLTCSAIGEQLLAADLDQITTIEKSLLIRFNEHRVAGAADDIEGRRLASALARKRARAALPNEFVTYLSPLQNRVKDKHGKQTLEGRFLSTMREIRVAAHPNWSADHVNVHLEFIFDNIDEVPDDADVQAEALINLLSENERYHVTGRAVSLEELTAAQYVNSDALDLDALSEG